MRQAKQIVTDMMTGLVIWGAAVMVVLEIVSQNRAAMAVGVLVGLLTAAGLILHMYRHLDIALDMDSEHAQRHTQFAAMQRFAIMAVVLAVSMTWYRYIHPVGMVFGIFGVKICALMQPWVHRVKSSRTKGSSKPTKNAD